MKKWVKFRVKGEDIAPLCPRYEQYRTYPRMCTATLGALKDAETEAYLRKARPNEVKRWQAQGRPIRVLLYKKEFDKIPKNQ